MTERTLSRLHLERVVDCPFSAVQDYVTDFLHQHRFGRTPNRFALRPDMAERGKPHDEVFIHWAPAGRIVPEIDVVLRFRIVRLSTRILLDGEYSAPLSVPGAIVDRAFGRHVMRGILAELLRRIASYVEQEERQYRFEHPPVLGSVMVGAS
jgi:hypothetical protein